MKIIIYRWNSYNQQDIEDIFTELGYEVTILSKQPSSVEKDDDYTEMVFDRLNQTHYDFLFSVNYFPVLAKACKDSDTPYLCWNCDSPLIAMYHESIFYDTNYIFTFDKSNCEEFQSLGVKHIFHMPLAPNLTHFNRLFGNNNPTKKYDVSFVGSLYDKNSFDDIAPLLPDYLCGYLDGAIYAQIQVSGGNLLEKLLTPDICNSLEDITNYHKSSQSFADIKTLFSTTVLGFKAASLQRHLFLSSLSKYLRTFYKDKYSVNLFTDNKTDELPFVQKHGKVDYRTQMPFIFRESKINLNMTIPNIKTGIPLRVWDILGCGGFLMTDYRIELTDYFVPGKDIVIYEDTEELQAKAAFYLEHDSLRHNITKNAYDKICKFHSCRQRMTDILQIWKTNY